MCQTTLGENYSVNDLTHTCSRHMSQLVDLLEFENEKSAEDTVV